MGDVLSLALRPKKLSELVGCESLQKEILQFKLADRLPRAWLFVGGTGTGKTTVARILSRAVQCGHGAFGDPCEECQKTRWDITEINASEMAGVDAMAKVAEASRYAPREPSRFRVIILDECQRLSDAAQNLLLKHLEDTPKKTIWILCTTNSQKLLQTVRSRCIKYTLPGLKVPGVKQLVATAAAYLLRTQKKKVQVGPLVDMLLEQDVRSPRMVLMAVEKYAAGASAEDAVGTETTGSAVDTLKVCQAVRNGDWKTLSVTLRSITAEDALAIVLALMGYLKGVLLNTKPGYAGMVAARAIRQLSRLTYMEPQARQLAVVAVLYDITVRFQDKKMAELEVGGDDDDDDDEDDD